MASDQSTLIPAPAVPERQKSMDDALYLYAGRHNRGSSDIDAVLRQLDATDSPLQPSNDDHPANQRFKSIDSSSLLTLLASRNASRGRTSMEIPRAPSDATATSDSPLNPNTATAIAMAAETETSTPSVNPGPVSDPLSSSKRPPGSGSIYTADIALSSVSHSPLSTAVFPAAAANADSSPAPPANWSPGLLSSPSPNPNPNLKQEGSLVRYLTGMKSIVPSGGDSVATDYSASSLLARRNSSASVDSAKYGAMVESMVMSGSWSEEKAELAAQQARAQQQARSFFQKAEETYQLQAAVALRVMADAELAEETEMRNVDGADDQFLDMTAGIAFKRGHAEATAYRFWVSGCLNFEDRIEDGFYDVWGISPSAWGLCVDPSQRGRMPNLDTLKTLNPGEANFEVTLLDRSRDPQLRELEDLAVEEGFACHEIKTLARKIGILVSNHFGGPVQSEVQELTPRYRQRSFELRTYARTIVIPIGQMSVGLCRHRALLFKLLMDMVDQKCRIARGCQLCGMDDGSSCVVVDGNREYVVDLLQDPGRIDSSLPAWQHPVNSLLRSASLSRKSLAPTERLDGEPNWMPEFRNFRRAESGDWEAAEDILAAGSRKLSNVVRSPARIRHRSSLPLDFDATSASASVSVREASPQGPALPLPPTPAPPPPEQPKPAAPVARKWKVKGEASALPAGERGSVTGPGTGPGGQSLAEESGKGVDLMPIIMSPNVMDVGSMEIIWEDIELGERVGAGTFGTVFKGEWNGSDVAVKILINQDQSEEQLAEFKREVIIMEKLRHPNIVLLMGAVTKPPNLSIITEFMHRGSLFRLLHRAGARETLKEERRLKMAMDVARGVNYLHKCNPMIVHRDLKSPNLLVDKNWTVKVCDFGLSANKNSTFLSSKSGAGTPEWMAPEVLRNEPSDEKSDVYSFGVILWEIATLKQPWDGMNPMQVVGAVGFQHKLLDIPEDLNPSLQDLIKSCWDSLPSNRPSFTDIIAKLKPMIVAAQKSGNVAAGARPPSRTES